MPLSPPKIFHSVAAMPVLAIADQSARLAVWPPKLPTRQSSSRPPVDPRSDVGDTPRLVSQIDTVRG